MNLNVISFNIRCCNDPNGYSIEERAPRLSKVISGYDADIIGLQEYRPAWEKHISKYFGEKFEIFNKYRCETTELESSPILWRKDKFECIKTGYFWLSDTPEVESKGWDEEYDCYRMCVYVILQDKVSGDRFTFMNTHFGFGDNGQVKSVKLIEEYSKKVSSLPTIIVGDFNMTPDSPAYSEISRIFTDVNTATVNDLRTTYHGYNPEKISNSHIDYCFVNKAVRPVSQKIIDDLVDGMFPSDHYGLHVKTEI